MAQGTFTFLGTGASTGIPVIGCSCAVCASRSAKNKRLRTSGLLQLDGKNFLIDATPDLRQQALLHHITHVDGLVLTHSHFDHIGGLEEMRIFNFMQEGPIDCLLSDSTYSDLQKLFFYHFQDRKANETYSAQFQFHVTKKPMGEEALGGLPFRYFRYSQGSMDVLGLRVGDLAYLTDIKVFSSDIFPFLEGVNTLVISALRFTPSIFHLSFDEAIAFAERVGAKESYFVHISHEIDHDNASQLLPKGISLAYDGLEICFKVV
jgi:phosphoribosyl 1,2-cyclic phosphate phosphodiesterase